MRGNPNSSKPRKNTSTPLYSSAGQTMGRLMVSAMRPLLAPATRAASSRSAPTARRVDEAYK